MAYAIEPLIFDKFKGIREYNGVTTGGQISAIQCQNIEFIQSEIGNATAIKSSDGNSVTYTLPEGYTIIEQFKSVQDGITYHIFYAENETQGALYYVDITGQLALIIEGLTVTGKANGLTMSSTAYDVFVFTNGEDIKTLCFTTDSAYADVIANYSPQKLDFGYVATITATDYLGRKIKGLAMTEWNGFLVIASDYGVHSSHQNDIYTWNENPKDIADAWYIDFSKKVTALYSFTGGLYIFTSDDCTYLSTTPNDTSSVMKTTAGIGCLNYQSIVKHDLYLFFYDNYQKNIYYLSSTDTTGQLRPSGPLAKEIQSYFKDVRSLKIFSCVYDNKNEIWCIVNGNILIYDYAQQEWVQRNEQSITNLVLINNTIYTGCDNIIYVENINDDFSGNYYPSVYRTTFINATSNTNLKKQKTPLLITINANHLNKFYVQLTVDNKEKNPKTINIKKNVNSNYAKEDGTNTDPKNKYGTAKFAIENNYKKTVVEVSTPQTWYTMSIKIFTKELGDGFFINSMELKNIKVKTKTRGR